MKCETEIEIIEISPAQLEALKEKLDNNNLDKEAISQLKARKRKNKKRT